MEARSPRTSAEKKTELGSPQSQSNTITIDSLKQIDKSNSNGFPEYK